MKRLSATFVGFATLLPLLLATAVLAQPNAGASGAGSCNTQIVVYIDVSGSVLTGADDSPYEQLLDGFQELVEDSDIITPTDEVTFVRFDRELFSTLSADGREAVPRVLAARGVSPSQLIHSRSTWC